MVQKTHRAKSKGSIRGNQQCESSLPAKKIKPVKNRIQKKEVYELTMKEIDALMKKGEPHLSPKEIERLRVLAEAAENYEDTHEPLHS